MMVDISLPLVTFIIPVYNTENYVGRAIDSVLAQTYANIEIILVNDGSTDNSLTICESYVRRNNAIKLINQTNSGVSAARNAAMQVSKGKYIQFMDSDDEINNDMTETFMKLMSGNDYDTVICGYSTIGRSNNNVVGETRCYRGKEILFLAYLDKGLLSLISSSANMIFKKNIIEEHNLKFNSEFAIGEDGLFSLDYLSKSKQVYVINESLYNYHTYEPNERVSAVSHFIPDVYELRIAYFKKLYLEIEDSLDDEQKNEILQVFHDRLISGLVRLGAYFELYSKKDIQNRIGLVLNDSFVVMSSKVYRRRRESDSWVIPLLIKMKSKKILIRILEQKGELYIRIYGKQSIIGSVFKKKI